MFLCRTSYRYPRPRYQVSYYRTIGPLGPVVQSIVSLMTSLRRQLVKYMLNTYANTSLFFVGKDSHIFPTKNNSVFVILTF